MPGILHSPRVRVFEIAVLSALLAVHTGCSTGTRKLDTKRPIDTEGGYRQGGEALNFPEMEAHLAKHPRAGRYIRRSQLVGLLGTTFAGSGGGLLGCALLLSAAGQTNVLFLSMGGAMTVSGLALAIWAMADLRSAVDAYNEDFETLEPERSTHLRVSPYLAAGPSGGWLLGVSARF